jgi:hypothetical protein
MIRTLRFALPALSALVAACSLCVTPAKATLMSTLLDTGGTVLVGDKLFSGFKYSYTGNMPPPDAVNVAPYIDGSGNFGIEFTGNFLDFVGNGGSDALIDFVVTVTDPNKQIVGVNLSGNPDVFGGSGVMAVTESFLPDITNATLNIYDIVVGATKLTDSILFNQGYSSMHVQKDILGFSNGGVASMSVLRQTFVQAEGPHIPEPATVTLMSLGLIGLCMVGLRKRRA